MVLTAFFFGVKPDGTWKTYTNGYFGSSDKVNLDVETRSDYELKSNGVLLDDTGEKDLPPEEMLSMKARSQCRDGRTLL